MLFTGDFPGRVSVTGHEKRAARALLKDQKGYEGQTPVLKIKVVISKVVFSGLLSAMSSEESDGDFHKMLQSTTRCRKMPQTVCCKVLSILALHVAQQISSESWGFSGVAADLPAVSRYTPPIKPCSTCRPSTARGVARQAPSEKVTLAGVALHCATQVSS